MSIDVYFGMANSKKHVLACGKKLSGASFMYGRGFKILNGIMNPEIDAGNRFLAYTKLINLLFSPSDILNKTFQKFNMYASLASTPSWAQ